MLEGFVSVKTIYDKVYRDLNVNFEIPEIDMLSWCAEALNLIGVYSQYEEISECLHLTDGKAKLPCGFYKLVDITYKGHPMYWGTNSNYHKYKSENCKTGTCNNNSSEKFTFYINDSYLISSINNDIDSDTNISIVYLGIRTDEDGYPLVPSDIYYQKALAAYIIHMVDYQEWRKAKITDKVKEDSEKNWLFYVSAATGAGNMPNTAMLENLKNVMRRLMPITNDYGRNFNNFNKKERLNLKS
jgi:hypothetical protein